MLKAILDDVATCADKVKVAKGNVAESLGEKAGDEVLRPRVEVS